MTFDIHIISIIPNLKRIIRDDGTLICGYDDLLNLISGFESISDDLLKKINSSIHRVTTLKPSRKRVSVTRTDSRGAILREIEGGMANLDKWQKTGAIEFPDGVQRIRGLAGSGKTIVLALKAAYLHAAHPDWDIVVTFLTRSLSQQFTDLIRRFTYEHSNDEPDWNKIRVMHTWGSLGDYGLYSDIAQSHEKQVKSFIYGKTTFAYEHAFEGVCTELINEIGEDNFKPQYDAILIDEAQDLPHSFFEMAYLACRNPKRIIYAYDELQNLSDYLMVPPELLFGKNHDGTPRVPDLRNDEKNPKQDIVLPICYRNTSWALSIAHALGFGIYRDEGLVQFFENPKLLNDIGYETISGELELGKNVILKRSKDSTPDYFDKLDNNDAVIFKKFENKIEQAKELAKCINEDLNRGELEFEDFLIILSDPITSKQEAGIIIKELNNLGIPSHLAGVTSSRDQLFYKDSIAITNIYRAKGNEAPMVYVINADYGYQGLELEKRRNILFTAITRSKAWVRVFGCGLSMDGLINEVKKIVNNNYEFRFKIPDLKELDVLRKIHRDRTSEERKEIESVEISLKKFIEMYKSGDLALENLPEDLRDQLSDIFGDELHGN